MSFSISTKSRYALRFMTYLATHEGYVSLKEVSEDEDISRKYLEQVTSLLVKDNLVESRRGKDGGYKLSNPPEEISVGDILRATEESLSTPVCTKCAQKHCDGTDCSTKPLWDELGNVTNDFLDSKKLSDLIEE